MMAVTTVGGCGVDTSEQRDVDVESNRVENSYGISAYEVTLKDGRVVQCVVAEGGNAGRSISCDFENKETNDRTQ